MRASLLAERGRMNGRGLTRREIEEAISVFGYSINYRNVVVYEDAQWLSIFARATSFLLRAEPVLNQAITLGYWVFFPWTIYTSKSEAPDLRLRDTAWLIHELTHVWQFEHVGARTLFKSIRAHARYGKDAYVYGGESGLIKHRLEGGHLDDLNPEQQGDVARHYYVRANREQDLTAWKPYVFEFKNAIYR